MFAAMKGTLTDAVIFCGIHDDVYPYWFENVLEDGEEDGFDNLVLTFLDENEEAFNSVTLEPFRSVVLRNHWGDIYHLNFDEFDKVYFEMGKFYAALKEDCVEYFILTPETEMSKYPHWFNELRYERFVVMNNDVRVWYAEDGEYAMSPTCVFIRNYKGEVRYLEPEQFEKHYIVPYPNYMIGGIT